MTKAFWVRAPGEGELRSTAIGEPGEDEVLVRTRYSGISKGTEALVLAGRVPESQYERMRAPFQDGDFPFPVKYGYLNVGIVERGPAELRGRTVFCLYPHQERYVVPADAVTPLPDGLPARRAILAGTVETALNALWDARPRLGDRVTVIGAGMVGCAVAALLTGFPGVDAQLVDSNPNRADVATALGAPFALPEQARSGRDLVVHASASEAGLATGLRLLARHGELLELSWYGDQAVRVPLGERFHAERLVLRSSQVGTVAHPRRGFAERMALALELLTDSRFDALITGESPFEELPAVLGRVTAELGSLCHRIAYPEPEGA